MKNTIEIATRCLRSLERCRHEPATISRALIDIVEADLRPKGNVQVERVEAYGAVCALRSARTLGNPTDGKLAEAISKVQAWLKLMGGRSTSSRETGHVSRRSAASERAQARVSR